MLTEPCFDESERLVSYHHQSIRKQFVTPVESGPARRVAPLVTRCSFPWLARYRHCILQDVDAYCNSEVADRELARIRVRCSILQLLTDMHMGKR